MEPSTIDIRGAREHNLRDVSLTLPRNSLIVFTGVSGSGKSSLAFDTLYAEGQRRYIESLSSYARQFMGQLPKPDCDAITGLSPSIAIQQKSTGWNPRSTVGTVTAIHDFLRVLYARIGVQHCTQCDRPISAQSREEILAGILAAFPGRDESSPPRALILAPVARGQKGEFRDLFDDLIRAGYVRARVDGAVVELRENLALDKNQRHDIEVVIDRVVLSATQRTRLAEAVENALRVGEGTLIVAPVGGEGETAPVESNADQTATNTPDPRSAKRKPDRNERASRTPRVAQGARIDSPTEGRSAQAASRKPQASRLKSQDSRLRSQDSGLKPPADRVFSSKFACAACGLSFEPPTPQLFSFNSPAGMCASCDGLGETYDFDPALLVPDSTLNFYAPCVAALRTKIGRWRRHIFDGVAKAIGFDIHRPWKDLPQKAKDALLYGTGDRHITYEWRWSGGVWKHGGPFEGVVAELRDKYRKANSAIVRGFFEKYMRRTPCGACKGARLKPQALAMRLPVNAERGSTAAERGSSAAGSGSTAVRRGPSLAELGAMSIADARALLDTLALSPVQHQIADEVLKEIRGRLDFLLNVGLHYLTLDRSAPTLSGGESQRIRLAGQIGAGLVGVLYILDEPSIGLHHRDNERLIESLIALRDMGNTVVVVEHDEATMRAADHIVDFGPGPGVRGGEVVAAGTRDEIAGNAKSLTGRYLSGAEKIAVPEKRRPVALSTK